MTTQVEMHTVHIFGRSSPACSFCTAAKRLAETLDKSVEVKYFDLTSGDWIPEELAKDLGVRAITSVPQIVVDGKHVGGFVEFSDLVRSSLPDV